jgi:hypothetical protein
VNKAIKKPTKRGITPWTTSTHVIIHAENCPRPIAIISHSILPVKVLATFLSESIDKSIESSTNLSTTTPYIWLEDLIPIQGHNHLTKSGSFLGKYKEEKRQKYFPKTANQTKPNPIVLNADLTTP